MMNATRRFRLPDVLFSVRGREITKDIVDCPPEMVNFENKKIDEIANYLF